MNKKFDVALIVSTSKENLVNALEIAKKESYSFNGMVEWLPGSHDYMLIGQVVGNDMALSKFRDTLKKLHIVVDNLI